MYIHIYIIHAHARTFVRTHIFTTYMHTHTHTHAQTYTPFIPSVIWLSRMNGTRQALAGTRTHTQTQTHTHTHARARTRTHAHTTHTHTHTHIRTHTDIRTYMHTHIHIRARTRTYMHTRAHADTHTHTHTQTCTHTHTCTPRHARARERRRVNEDAWTKTNKAHICTYTHDIMMSVLVHDSWLNTYRKALWKGSSRHCAPSIVKCTTFLQQHTATLRNRLQHFTTDCNTSQQTATLRNRLQHKTSHETATLIWDWDLLKSRLKSDIFAATHCNTSQ